MVTFRDFVSGLRKLELERTRPVLVHASLSAFGEVHGGVDALLGALLGAFDTVVAPAFTYKTMIIPEVGPEGNGLTYGSGKDANRMAEFFTPDMPADPLMGAFPEALRKRPNAQRSTHPILSFTAVSHTPAAAQAILSAQDLEEPLGPVHILRAEQGWVLLLGVDHTVNTSLHYAERLAGRKQFTRWALTPHGIVECPGFPGCSDGFQAISPRLQGIARQVIVGNAAITAVPLVAQTETALAMLAADPLSLLCSRPDCERCNAVRSSIA
jgi:aminoglycoside 3-N-acetyltransferase